MEFAASDMLFMSCAVKDKVPITRNKQINFFMM
jgi:hypothetical protein